MESGVVAVPVAGDRGVRIPVPLDTRERTGDACDDVDVVSSVVPYSTTGKDARDEGDARDVLEGLLRPCVEEVGSRVDVA